MEPTTTACCSFAPESRPGVELGSAWAEFASLRHDARRAADGRDGDRLARFAEYLAAAHLPIVREAMAAFRLDDDEACSESLSVLWACLRNFDPSQGTRFRDYALRALGRALYRLVRKRARARSMERPLRRGYRLDRRLVVDSRSPARETVLLQDALEAIDELPPDERSAVQRQFLEDPSRRPPSTERTACPRLIEQALRKLRFRVAR